MKQNITHNKRHDLVANWQNSPIVSSEQKRGERADWCWIRKLKYWRAFQALTFHVMLELDEKDLSPFKVDGGHNVDQSTLLLLIFYTPRTKGLFLMFGLAGNIAQLDVVHVFKLHVIQLAS